MSKQNQTSVVKKEETALAVPKELSGAWGSENIEAKDILIPRIFVAQKMSEVCDSEEVKPGEFYRSTDHEVLGGSKKPVELLVLSFFKTWTIEQKKGDRYEFEAIRPYVPADASLPWDFSEDGITKRRNETFNFYVLLISDIKANQPLPFVISFRRTSVMCAKQIVSYILSMKQFNSPACTHVLELTTHLKENDLGSFHVPQMKKGRRAEIEEMEVAKKWFDAINRGAVKVSPEEETVAPAAKEEY